MFGPSFSGWSPRAWSCDTLCRLEKPCAAWFLCHWIWCGSPKATGWELSCCEGDSHTTRIFSLVPNSVSSGIHLKADSSQHSPLPSPLYPLSRAVYEITEVVLRRGQSRVALVKRRLEVGSKWSVELRWILKINLEDVQDKDFPLWEEELI